MGATGFGYDLARQFNLPIANPRPASSPSSSTPKTKPLVRPLRRLRRSATASMRQARLPRKNAHHPPRTQRPRHPANLLLLDRHCGPRAQSHPYRLGPQPRLPRQPPRTQRPPRPQRRQGRPPRHLSARLAERLLDVAPPPNWTNPALNELERRLHAWTFTPASTEGYEKAEVTAGGVTPTPSTRKPWNAAMSRASTSSAKSSTSPAGSADSTSSGPGPPAQPPVTPSDSAPYVDPSNPRRAPRNAAQASPCGNARHCRNRRYFFTGTASHREQQKTTNPKPSDGQVHPIARSLPLRHPNVHTNQLGFYPEVLSCAVLGKSTVLDSPHRILRKPFCR